MSRTKFLRFLDDQNVAVCLQIGRTYFRKLEQGKSRMYLFHPRFWLLIFARCGIILLQLVALNGSFFRHIRSTARCHVSGTDFINTALAIFGVHQFARKEFLPKFYSESVSHIYFPVSPNPKVTVIIPVFNQVAFTLACLRSLCFHREATIEMEILVADDCSTDDTQTIIPSIEGITYMRNAENVGFLKTCNAAMQRAQGEYICLLNNDTIVQNGWLQKLLDSLTADPSVGCTGSKLIYPYGLLQEAGGVIYNDGNGINYGKFDYRDKPGCNFKRQVDYCSGASILFRKSDAEALGYFDEQYVPAYYEDTDFCFAITHVLKKKVMYVPGSVVVHFEGISSGKQAKRGNVKAYQVINKGKFTTKWADVLINQGTNPEPGAKKYVSKKQILVVDDILPAFDKDSGSNRMFRLIQIFQRLHYHVIFYPKDGKPTEPYFSMLTDRGVEVLQNYQGFGRRSVQLRKVLNHVSIAWICRPKLNKKFQRILPKFPSVCWLYDTVDLHYVRQTRESFLHPANSSKRKRLLARAARYKKLETRLSLQADATIAITDVEANELKKNGAKKVELVPNIHVSAAANGLSFHERSGVTFIGNFTHTPNKDAVLWLLSEIMPLVWKIHPEIKVNIVGAGGSWETHLLSIPNVIFTGFVANVDSYFNAARIFVAPLRFGAGMKGKIGQSMEYGLPAVSTSIGVEGMGLTDGKDILVANTAEEFSTQLVRLYSDQILWERIAWQTKQSLLPFTESVQSENIRKILNNCMSGRTKN